MTDLQQHLTDNPNITVIYFNDNGEWLFGANNPNYPISKTREEVLGETKVSTSKKVK